MRNRLERIAKGIALIDFAPPLLRTKVLARILVRTLACLRSNLIGAAGMPHVGREKSVARCREDLRRPSDVVVFQGGMRIDEEGLWVKIVVTRGPQTASSPHEVKHTLTFHGPDGCRV